MVSKKSVTKQLRQIGCDYAVWGRTEIHELPNILMDNERIMQSVNGYYDGGFALLCITNYRVLVVDKKPFLLTVEDLRYDMIAEVDYSSRILTSVLHIYTPMRTLMFTSWSITRLRKSMNYIQQRVMELRNNDYLASQFATATAQRAAIPPLKRQQVSAKKIFQLHQTRDAVPISEEIADIPTLVETVQPDSSRVNETENQKEPDFQLKADAQPYQLAQRMINPYTKVPLLSRHRKYPSFY
jgi:hypothetical protein